MQIVNRKYTIILVLIVIAMGTVSLLPLDLPYKTSSKAIIKPSFEWELLRDAEGTIASVYHNHENGLIESYGNTEFRRGDVMHFYLRSDLSDGDFVDAGDTIGYTYSNEEQMRLIELEGKLEVLQSQLGYYTAGQKPEDIEWAEKEVMLASQELETQQKLMARSERLMKDSVISTQQYEIDLNELRVKEMRKVLAEAKLKSLLAGDKPEQITLTQSQIAATRQQINQIKQRLNFLTLTTPVSGVLSSGKSFKKGNRLLRVIDNKRYIGVAPIKLDDKPYIEQDNDVYLVVNDFEKIKIGRVVAFNNEIKLLNGEPVVYVTIAFDETHDLLIPGNLVTIEVVGTSLNPRQYMIKTLQTSG